MEFIGDRGAPDLRVAFQHEGFESSLGQIKRGDEAVVASADDDDIALRVSVRRHAYAAPLMSFRISSAASRPFAPMIPPPGCVAEPHMYRFLIGVRYCAHPGTGRRKKSCSSESSPWKMLPSLSPHSRSRSSGVTTCFSMMMSFKLGAYWEIVSTTVLPKASFSVSQFSPGASL